MITQKLPPKQNDLDVEAIQGMNSRNDEYLHDSIHTLFSLYNSTKDKDIKKAAKLKYNELVEEEHARLGRDVFKLL